jgi:hypothetical protein
MKFRVKVIALRAQKNNIVLDKGMAPGLLGSCVIEVPEEKLSSLGKLYVLDGVEEAAREWMETFISLEITEEK